VVLNFEWAGIARKAGSRRLRSSLPRALRIAFATGVAAYSILSAVAGPAGLVAYRRLAERKADMEDNLALLAAANGELRAEVESLSADADRAAREARSLGYLSTGETEVVLDGWAAAPSNLEVGTILPFAQPASLPDESIKGISLGVVLAALAISIAPKNSGGGNSAYRERRTQRASRE